MLIGHAKTATIDDSAVSEDHVKAADWNGTHKFQVGSIIPVAIANLYIDGGVIDADSTGLQSIPARISTGVLTATINGLATAAISTNTAVSYLCSASTPRWPGAYAGWEAFATVSGDTLTIGTLNASGAAADVDNVSISVVVYAVISPAPPPI